MKEALPTTLHELFCSLILCCIIRELKTHEQENALIDISGLSSLDDLPDSIKSKLYSLCVLAFNGVVENKVVFYEKDLKDFHLPSHLSSLGLLQSVEGLTLYSTSLSYNFVHLSVQELLSAYVLSKLDMSQQFELIKSMFGSSRFQAVLHYYSGFTKLVNPEIQNFICTQQQIDILLLLHCFYEAQEPSLCKLVKSRIPHKKNLMSFNFELNPVDYLAIGYFITSLLSVPSDAPNLHIRIDNTDDHKLKLLLVELSKYSVTAGASPSRLELELYTSYASYTQITDKAIMLIASHLKESPLISELTMSVRSGEDLVRLTQALYTNSYLTKCKFIGHGRGFKYYTKEGCCLAFGEMFRVNKSLTNFRLKGTLFDLEARLLFEGLRFNTTLTHLNLKHGLAWITKTTGQELCTMLKINKTLTHLNLSGHNTRDDSFSLCYYIFQGLLHNMSLIHLDLSNIGLADTEDSIKALSKMLQVNTSLQYLNLSNNNYSDFGVSCIFQSLHHNTALAHLNLSDTKFELTEATLEALGKLLQVNSSLKHLNLSENKISISVVSRVFQSLCHTTTLVHLNLSNMYGFRFTDAPQALFCSNYINKTLTYLNLSGIRGLKIHIIFQDLQHNTTLVELYLRNTGLVATEDTTQALTTMLQVNKTLKYLDLSYNKDFSDLGAHCVFTGLQHNTTLVHLYLSSTGLVEAPTTMLQDNNTLTLLSLSSNWTSSHVNNIFSNIQHNTTLVYLYLHDTGLVATEETVQALITMLQVNKSLTHLDLSKNKRLSDSGAHCVLHATSLVYLNLDDSEITDEGAEYIAKIIDSNHSLESLTIAGNNITEDGFAYIAKSLETAPSMKYLYVRPNPVTCTPFSKNPYNPRPWRISIKTCDGNKTCT